MSREAIELVSVIWVVGGMAVAVAGLFLLVEVWHVNLHSGRVGAAAFVTMWLLAPLTLLAIVVMAARFVALGFVEAYRIIRPAKPKLPKAQARKAA